MSRTTLVSLLALGSPSLAHAQAAGVPGGGSCSYATIQAAIDAAAANTGAATILVAPGVTHRENLVVDASVALWSSLTIDMGDAACDAVGVMSTTLNGDTDADGTADGHVLDIHGMTVPEMLAGRAVLIHNQVIEDGGPGRLDAGAVVVESAGATLFSSVIRDSDARPTGLGGGLFATSDAIVGVVDSSLTQLDAESGGAIAVTDGASVTLTTGSVVSDSSAIEDGGLVYADDGTLTALFATTFLEGTAAGGGCIAAFNGSEITLTVDVDVDDCVANGRGLTAAGLSFGGGALVDHSLLELAVNAEILNGEADRGGGVYVTGEGAMLSMGGTPSVHDCESHGPGGGVFATDHALVELTGVTFLDPQAEDVTMWNAFVADCTSWTEPTEAMGHGGGVFIEADAHLEMESASISGNQTALGASRRGIGGGLFVTGATATLTNSTIHMNTAREGGGMVVGPGADVGLVATPLVTSDPPPDLCAEIYSTIGMPNSRQCTEIYGNIADDGRRGAAVLVEDDGVLSADFTAIRRNRVEDPLSEGTKAYVWVEPGGFMTANSVLISDNGAARVDDPLSGPDDATVSVEVEGADGNPGRFLFAHSTFGEQSASDSVLRLTFLMSWVQEMAISQAVSCTPHVGSGGAGGWYGRRRTRTAPVG